MGEAAKLIFGQPVMIDGFALNSGAVPVRHFTLLNEVAQTVNALRFFNDGGMVFLWGETDLSGETGYNDALAARRADAVATYLRIAGVPPGVIQTISVGSAFASRTSRQDAASRRVEIRFQEPPAVQPTQQAPPVVARPQFRVERLPPPRIPNPSQFPPFTMTPIPNPATQFGWPGLFKDEARQTWCQNIATLITISDGSGAMGNALGGAVFSDTGGREQGAVYASAGPGYRAAEYDDLQSAAMAL